MIEYQVILAPTAQILTVRVKIEIFEGWIPLGGVAVDKDDYLYQAMTREVKT